MVIGRTKEWKRTVHRRASSWIPTSFRKGIRHLHDHEVRKSTSPSESSPDPWEWSPSSCACKCMINGNSSLKLTSLLSAWLPSDGSRDDRTSWWRCGPHPSDYRTMSFPASSQQPHSASGMRWEFHSFAEVVPPAGSYPTPYRLAGLLPTAIATIEIWKRTTWMKNYR